MPVNYGYGGACQTAAIVISNTVASSDLNTYLSSYGVTRTGTVTTVAVDGGGPVDNEGEATLDLETIAGNAPNANVIVYNMPDLTDKSIIDTYNKVASDGVALVVNSSFGGCESNPYSSATDQIATGAAAIGMTFSASSGDQGQGCYNGPTPYPFGVSAAASDPHFVAVGGTQSNAPASAYNFYCPSTATAITNPAVWSDCVEAGGGGLSTLWTPPPWQAIPGASTLHRNVPDIALPAAYDDFYFQGHWGLIWGTSWSSPIYVAMQTEINQACGKAWGMSTLYGAYAKHTTDFVDVVNGTNAWHLSMGLPYSATAGFDNVSGLGIPLGIYVASDNCTVPLLRRR